jgi:hypothetical protein
MKVALIDTERGKVISYGESDMKRVEGIYVRVTHNDIPELTDRAGRTELVAAIFVVPIQYAQEYAAMFKRHVQERKELGATHYKEATAKYQLYTQHIEE